MLDNSVQYSDTISLAIEQTIPKQAFPSDAFLPDLQKIIKSAISSAIIIGKKFTPT